MRAEGGPFLASPPRVLLLATAAAASDETAAGGAAAAGGGEGVDGLFLAVNELPQDLKRIVEEDELGVRGGGAGDFAGDVIVVVVEGEAATVDELNWVIFCPFMSHLRGLLVVVFSVVRSEWSGSAVVVLADDDCDDAGVGVDGRGGLVGDTVDDDSVVVST